MTGFDLNINVFDLNMNGTLKYDWICPNMTIGPKYDWIVLNMIEFLPNMTQVVLNMTGFLLNITESFLNMTDFHDDDHYESNGIVYVTVLTVSRYNLT